MWRRLLCNSPMNLRIPTKSSIGRNASTSACRCRTLNSRIEFRKLKRSFLNERVKLGAR
jgi:hypothetical protein